MLYPASLQIGNEIDNTYSFAAFVITTLASCNLPTDINHLGDSGSTKKYNKYINVGVAMPKLNLSQDFK